MASVPAPGRLGLRCAVLGYLGALLLVPVGMVAYRTFEHGAAPVYDALTAPAALHALRMSLLVTVVSVPLDLVFGIGAGLLLARHRFAGRTIVNLLVDLPFAMSPVVIGLGLYVLYGAQGWLGGWLTARGIQVLFSLPGMVLATTFVCLPFVAREVIPVLREAGVDQEHAAATLGAGPVLTFLRVTLPTIRWAVVYGVILSVARALGEFGAVSIVSGNVVGSTQTLPLYVEDRFSAFDTTGAYSAGLLLAVVSLLILAGMTVIGHRKEPS